MGNTKKTKRLSFAPLSQSIMRGQKRTSCSRFDRSASDRIDSSFARSAASDISYSMSCNSLSLRRTRSSGFVSDFNLSRSKNKSRSNRKRFRANPNFQPLFVFQPSFLPSQQCLRRSTISSITLPPPLSFSKRHLLFSQRLDDETIIEYISPHVSHLESIRDTSEAEPDLPAALILVPLS